MITGPALSVHPRKVAVVKSIETPIYEAVPDHLLYICKRDSDPPFFKMEEPTGFSFPHPNLTSPTLSTSTTYGQPLTSSLSGNFSSNDGAPGYYRHVAKPFDYGQSYGLDVAIPKQSMTATSIAEHSMPFEISSVPGQPPPQSTGMPYPSPMQMNPFAARPTSMQSVHSQENMLGSPMQGLQGTTNATFPTFFSSQKRAADGPMGVLGEEGAEVFNKRPRLNVAIHAMQMDTSSAQTSPFTLHSNTNSTMAPIDSAPNPVFSAAMPISRSNSMVMPGQQSTTMALYSPQMQGASFAQHHPFRAPSVVSIPSSLDYHRQGALPTSNQNMPLATTPLDRKLSSTASSAGFLPSVVSHNAKAALEGFSPFHPARQPLTNAVIHHGHVNDGRFTLVVKQQPERARLCSFKEENDTSRCNVTLQGHSTNILALKVDRRPVDPPPIIQIIPATGGSIS